jgi:hypothetical protein
MNFSELLAWMEKNPVAAIAIGGGGVIAIMYLLGYFSPTPAATTDTSGQTNLAAAYYAAEANQANVGGAIQVATIQAAAATAMDNSNNNAAVAINAAQTGAATTINSQNVNGELGLGDQALNATYNSNAAAVQVAQSNNATAGAIANTQLQGYLAQEQTIGGIYAGQQQAAVQIAQANNSWWNIF